MVPKKKKLEKIETLFGRVSAPPKKSRNKKRETINGKSLSVWVEYWNLHKTLKYHKPGTRMYEIGDKELRLLVSRGFAKSTRWDDEWLYKKNIPAKFLVQPWSQVDMRRAIRMLSLMASPGYWPGPGSFLTKSSIQGVVYAPQFGTSILLEARTLAKPRKLFQQINELNWEKASPQAQALAGPLRQEGIRIYPKVAENIARQYNLLCKGNPLMIHLCGGLEGFGRMLSRWLLEKNVKNPGKAIAPPNGRYWIEFVRTFDVSEG